MFDFNVTTKWVTAVLTDPNGAASAYREPLADWQHSFLTLVLPVTVAAYLIAALLALVTGGTTFGLGSPLYMVFSAAWALAWSFVIAHIFDFLAGTFGGRKNFNAAYAVVALVLIPSAIGTAISPLPWLGGLISLVVFVYALVLTYRLLPQYLEIPQDARVKHFLLSIVAAVVVNIVVTMSIGSAFSPSLEDLLDDAATQSHTTDIGGRMTSGLFGGLERQAALTEAATKDTYEPPRDGRLTREQVHGYVAVVEKTRALRTRLDGDLSERYQNKDPSISDLFGGISGVARLGTAELEVVKSGGGNWAEHQWVKAQLETARIHQDLDAATAHNYALYREVADRLAALR